MRNLLECLLVLAFGFFLGLIAASGKPEITWLGCPQVSNNDTWTPSSPWFPDFQIGLRDDGIVVWSTNKDFNPRPSK